MKQNQIYLGNTAKNISKKQVTGQFVDIGNEKFYKISNVDQMPDFFMTIVSDSDHWMYLSSNGSLSAGRKNRNNALFPYYTVDKIHDYRDRTGSKTFLLVTKADKTYLWEPFSSESEKIYPIQRNLYKSIYGNKVIFEEVNQELGVGFRYGWYNSEKFGFVKKSEIQNLNTNALSIDILDGIVNILPNGVDHDFQNAFSCLLDAYKKCELLPESKLGLYMLSSIPVDRAEPSESLKATAVWFSGSAPGTKILISAEQVANFTNGFTIHQETDVRAKRGAYFVNASFELPMNASNEWMIVAEVNRDSSDVANLDLFLKNTAEIAEQVNADIHKGTENLKRIVSNADGMQLGNEELSFARHFSNTLFNVMRGGVFTNNYHIDTADFKLFAKQTNKQLSLKQQAWFSQLPAEINYPELLKQAERNTDADLMRICYEYLPLTFSRRHGDPSRPWNQFSIETKNDDGTVKLNYQGNWRDIFQNWEALGLSFPEFLEGIISKFVNASTPDGYNPYRITREGIDWECPDPHDPWAYIGYWGDHQIIYLQKFLELSNEFHPGKLDEMLTKELFAYANVPYRIKSYSKIVENPKDTIEFDFELNDKIRQQVRTTGADGNLLRGVNGDIYLVNFTEKILVTLLAKLSNFIPEAGIWLNTQRPEWNDANNALVGNGVSMVTLYYLRRFLKFWSDRFLQTDIQEISISEEVKMFFDSVHTHFTENSAMLTTGFTDSSRRQFADILGEAGSTYRTTIYKNNFSGKRQKVEVSSLLDFVNLSLLYMDQSIKVNKRDDGLYHAYNLVSISDKSMAIRHLYEMLEGQVAVLSSGYLSVQESLDVLNSLKYSQLFRRDQYSYLLYPDRQLPRFTEKNNIPSSRIPESNLLSQLISANDSSILSKDDLGNYHFNGAFRNAAVLENALHQLDASRYAHLVAIEKDSILALYEEIFDHQSFTGRSGTFYGYEGLGSIYWHMVSKLLLACQESYFRGVAEGADAVALGKIKDHYYEINAGIGLNKSPLLYGAFPTDAYSHTPGNAGAQQPGMTGQVKEDFLARMHELGIHIEDGEISFRLSLLNPAEFLTHESVFSYFNLQGESKQIPLQKGELGFTFCQVPVVYSLSDKDQIDLRLTDGQSVTMPGHIMRRDFSRKVFRRSSEIEKIVVQLTGII